MVDSDDPRQLRRVVIASFIGTLIEWYDFFLYGSAAALVFNHLFFPSFDPASGTLAAFATYSVGFLARPIGGMVFGHFGDRIGRRAMLITTLVMMGLSTFLVGVLPGYDSIGIAAPILLTVLRFIQGFGVGGEWGGAVLLVIEHSHGRRRGFFSSWPQAGVPAGLLVSTAVFMLVNWWLPPAAFMSWGWRLPFLFGIVLVAIGLLIRLSILESPLFAEVQARREVARIPIIEVLARSPLRVVQGIGARLVESIIFYLVSVWFLSYGISALGLDKTALLMSLLVGAGCECVTVPLCGALSDRLGRRPVYLAGVIITGLLAFPLFWLLESKTACGRYAAMVLGLGVGHALMYGPQAALFCELFETRVRYSGASIVYQFSSLVGGGLAPLIAAALLRWGDGRPWMVALYIMIAALISAVSISTMKETSRTGLS